MKTKFVSASLAALALIVSLTGCGNTDSSDSSKSKDNAPKSNVYGSKVAQNGSSVKSIQVGDSELYEDHVTLSNGVQVVCLDANQGAYDCDWAHAVYPPNLEGQNK